MEPGEWDIPRVPLRHDRAVIAARVLSARLRTARRTGRALYDPAAHHPTAPHEQLLLFAQEQRSTAARPAVDLATLRIRYGGHLELTADQIAVEGLVVPDATQVRTAARRINGYVANASEYGSRAKASSPANDWAAAAGSSSGRCPGCPATGA
jgi:hypothetical protein